MEYSDGRTGYARMEGDQPTTLYPQLQTQYAPAAYGTVPPTTAQPVVLGERPPPMYTVRGVKTYAKKNKSNACKVVLCCLCLIVIVVGATIGILFAVATAQCQKPRFTEVIVQNFGREPLTALTIQHLALLGGNVTVRGVPSDTANHTVTIVRSASKSDALDTIVVAVSDSGTGALSIDVTGIGGIGSKSDPQHKSWQGDVLGALFACQKADIVFTLPRTSAPSVRVLANDAHIILDAVDAVNATRQMPPSTSFDLETTEGDVTVTSGEPGDAPRATTLTAKTTDGSVDLSGSYGDVTASTVNGAITMTNLHIDKALGGANAITLTTVNGEITVTDRIGAADAAVTSKTTNGAQKVTLSAAYGGTYDLKTTNGAVTASGAVQDTAESKTHHTGTIHAGGAGVVHLTATNGDVELSAD